MVAGPSGRLHATSDHDVSVADTGSIDILLMHPKYFASSSNPDRHYIIPLPSTNYQYYTVNQPRRGDKRTLHSVCVSDF